MATAPRLGPRLPRHLRVEDIVLFLWLVLRPLVLPGSSRGATVPGYDPPGGLFDLVALCGAAACVVARRRDSSHTGLIRDEDVAYAVGPLFGAVAFALNDCTARLGLSGGAETLALVLPVGAAVGGRLWLPPTSAPQRRALVTPFLMATSGFFGEFLSGFTDIFDLRSLASGLTSGQLGETGLVFGFVLAGMAIFYLMLVFAPRQIAEREGTPASWTVRFLVFALALSLGTTFSAMARGL